MGIFFTRSVTFWGDKAYIIIENQRENEWH